MISLEQFKSLIDYLIERHEKLEKFEKQFGNVFTIEFEVDTLGINSSLFSFLGSLINDDDDWLGYFFFECDCSFEKLATNAEVEEHDLSTVEGFYKMLVED